MSPAKHRRPVAPPCNPALVKSRRDVDKAASWSFAAAAFSLLSGTVTRRETRLAIYTAVMADGQRVTGGHLTGWGNSDLPTLNGQPLHNQADPIRWLRRETTDQPALPKAYLEMVGGDVMPGRVVGLAFLDAARRRTGFVPFCRADHAR